jgi:hypothetical protein
VSRTGRPYFAAYQRSSPPQMAGRFAAAGQQKPTRLLHLEHVAQVKARRNDPSVDGAQIPPNTTGDLEL